MTFSDLLTPLGFQFRALHLAICLQPQDSNFEHDIWHSVHIPKIPSLEHDIWHSAHTAKIPD
jgi:hypothetical protein